MDEIKEARAGKHEGPFKVADPSEKGADVPMALAGGMPPVVELVSSGDGRVYALGADRTLWLIENRTGVQVR